MDASRRCHAHSKRSGERCGRAAIRGGSVCHFHGGKSPVAIAKAEDRLKSLVHPAITALASLIADNDLAAARYVLDYAGFKATEKVQSEGRQVIEIEYVDRPNALELPPSSNGAVH